MPDELKFDDPPSILGRGTFGLVLLAEYRGTQVAVKRVIPPKSWKKGKKGKEESGWRNSLLGEGDVVGDETTLSTNSLQLNLSSVSNLKTVQVSDVGVDEAIQNNAPFRPHRRASLSDIGSTAVFDFDVLDDAEKGSNAKLEDEDGARVGMESGGMQRFLELSRPLQLSMLVLVGRVRDSLFHSVNCRTLRKRRHV